MERQAEILKKAPRRTRKSVSQVESALKREIEKLGELRKTKVYPLLLTSADIGATLVDEVYDDLQQYYRGGTSCLDVIVHSSGGDIDAAYNLAQLLRTVAKDRLTFIVPRWAKSAATLLVCGGDSILMTPVAELGPLDPQITQMNPWEERLESFSPLHIDATLKLIREEYEKGNLRFADALTKRLQFPLTLGSFKMTIELGKQYLVKLLTTRMLNDKPEMAQKVASRLTEGYADHGFCINLHEAQEIGLKAEALPEDQLQIVWEIHRLRSKKHDLELAKRRAEMEKAIKELPPELRELLEKLPPGLLGHPRETLPLSSS